MPRGDGIKQLSQLFDKYKNTLKAPQASVINVFIEVIHELYEIELKKEWVVYNPQTKTINLKAPGPIISEIKLNKKEITDHLKGRLGVNSAPKEII